MKALHIKQWDNCHETYESRRLKVLSWYASPNKTDGYGWSVLRGQPNRTDLLAAWDLLKILASKAPDGYRGWLVRNGQALSAEEMGFLTGWPVEIFEKAIPFFQQPKVDWLEEKEIPEGLQKHFDLSAGAPGQSAGAPGQSAGAPGQSAAVPAPSREGRKDMSFTVQTGQTVQDRQTVQGDKKNGDRSSTGGKVAASRTQFAALRAELKDHPGQEDDATEAERRDLQRKKAALKALQKQQAAGEF